MKNFKVTAILATAALSLFGSARAADLYVIANPSVELAENQIHDVFVGNMQIVRGAKIIPMDNATLQAEFLEKVLKLDGQKYGLIWTKKGFREGLNRHPSNPVILKWSRRSNQRQAPLAMSPICRQGCN